MSKPTLPNEVERAENRAMHEASIQRLVDEHCEAISEDMELAQQEGKRKICYYWGGYCICRSVPREVRRRVYAWVRSQPGYRARASRDIFGSFGAMVVIGPLDRPSLLRRLFC